MGGSAGCPCGGIVLETYLLKSDTSCCTFLTVGAIQTVIYKHKEKIWKGLSEMQLQGNSLSFVAFYHDGNFPFLLLWEVQELPLNEMKVIVSCLQYDAVGELLQLL